MSDPAQLVLRLRLYVDSQAPETALVERNLGRLFEEVGLRYEVETIDVREQPDAAARDRIVLTPTLMRITPPEMRIAGDLSNTEAALDGLGLRVWEQRWDNGRAGGAVD